MVQVNNSKVRHGEVLTLEELRIIRAGGSPWPYTTAPKRPEKEPPKKKKAAVMV